MPVRCVRCARSSGMSADDAGMQYLGPEYDPAAMAYRLKFIRDGRVVFVDVDARSGQIIHHSP